MKITGNESAYPIISEELQSKYIATPPTLIECRSQGLTIRQLIAKDFMVAMLTNPALLEALTADDIKTNTCAERVSEAAIRWTDIFIAELNKEVK